MRTQRAVSTLTLVVAVVVVVAAAALAAYLMLGHNGSGGSPASSIKAPAVVIVYKPGQKGLADSILAAVKSQLASSLPSGVKYYAVEASSLGLTKLPVYPALLFKLPVSEMSPKLRSMLEPYTLPGGYKPFRYDYFASYVSQVALLRHQGFPSYTHKAVVLIVEGEPGLVKIDRDKLRLADARLRLAFSALFVANVTKIEVLKSLPSWVNASMIKEYPAVLAVSSADLSRFNPDLARVGNNTYYDVNASAAKFLVYTGIASAALVEAEQIPTLQHHPAIGHGPVNVAVFEDILCPYCARLYHDAMPTLYRLAENNTITLHLMDLVVHPYPQDMEFHHLMACYFSKTGNSTGYFTIVNETYSKLFNCGKGQLFCQPVKNFLDKLSAIIKNLEKEYGVTPNCTASKYVEESSTGAAQLGIMGTPGIVVWRTGSKYMLVTMGYHNTAWFMDVIKWFETH